MQPKCQSLVHSLASLCQVLFHMDSSELRQSGSHGRGLHTLNVEEALHGGKGWQSTGLRFDWLVSIIEVTSRMVRHFVIAWMDLGHSIKVGLSCSQTVSRLLPLSHL